VQALKRAALSLEQISHGGTGIATASRELTRKGLVPPWLKIVVVEELGEARASYAEARRIHEDDRVGSPALWAVGHRQGWAHGPYATHHR
jgi:hypothetical protein